MLTDFLSQLIEADNACLLAINGWHAPWADTFMYAFSGKIVWIPLYASLLYVIVRNLRWQVALGCAVAIALTIVLADQIGASLIRPKQNDCVHPIWIIQSRRWYTSLMVTAADVMVSLRVMLPTPLVLPFLSFIFSVIGCSQRLFRMGSGDVLLAGLPWRSLSG